MRSRQTKEERDVQTEADRERRLLALRSETPAQREQRLRAVRQRRARYLSTETPAQREKRLRADRVSKRNLRALQSEACQALAPDCETFTDGAEPTLLKELKKEEDCEIYASDFYANFTNPFT